MRLASIIAASLLLTSVAAAQTAPPPPPPPPAQYGAGASYGPGSGYAGPGAHAHEGGYFRAYTGIGYLDMTASEGGADTSIHGVAGILGLAGGYAVAPNLILYGELLLNIAFGPEVEIKGVEFDTDDDDVSAGNVGFGIGVAYYLMPANIYLSGTLAVSKVRLTVDDQHDDTKYGPSVSLMVGKEWWVSDNWGLGVAAELFAGRMVTEDDGPTVTSVAAGLVFSVTYN